MRTRWETAPNDIMRPLITLWLLVLALYPFARKITDDWDWAGILLTIIVFGFFSEGNYFLIVSVFTGSVFLILLIYLFLRKRRFHVFYLSSSLTFIGFALLTVQSYLLLGSLSSIPRSYYEAMDARKVSLSIPISEPASGIKPDIYYIVLDAYSGADVLRDFYDYDNSAFLDYLKDLGFIIPETALSNYPRTALSISSTLDMQYWDSISPDLDDVIQWWLVKPVLNDSRVRASLESIGYQTVSIASDWDITNNTTTDYYFKPFPVILSEYEDTIITSTPLEMLYKPFQDVAPVRTNEVHRHFITYGMETLTKIPEIPGPKFVFAHIILPHPPFVFDADGNPIDLDDGFTFGSPKNLSRAEYRQHYLDHIEYLNAKLHFVLETILNQSKTPPIILLQADHGLGLSVSFSSSENTCLRERFSAFGAYYLPGKGQNIIPKDFTSVNLFRIIFNEYFGTTLDLLENHQYLTQGHNMFSGLRDVTQDVRDRCVVTPIEQ